MDSFQPPPLYPPIISKALSLENNDQYREVLRIKKELRNAIQSSSYYIQTKVPLIERYSDSVSKIKSDSLNKWVPVWNRLPKELKYYYEKDEKDVKKKRKLNAKPNLSKAKSLKIDLGKLEKLDKEDEMDHDENEKDEKEGKGSDKESGNEDNLEEDENADEEDVEEDNDYIDDYFDNGENYGDDDGGGDEEGPVY